jgi:hypothetical protein
MKKENMQKKITEYIESVLTNANESDSLDYFKIDITNHNERLQLEHQYRKREKAYQVR